MTTRSAPRRKRPKAIDPSLLKTTLVVGSVLATYLGADRLANANQTAAAPVEPLPVAQVINIPSSGGADGFTLTLEPIPDVVSADQIPRPVARSQSSG